jgi:tetratricopeptide (TPR) repeat protein
MYHRMAYLISTAALLLNSSSVWARQPAPPDLSTRITTLSEQIRQSPTVADLLISRGALQAISGKAEEGLKDFEAATRLNPKSPEAWLGVANTQAELNHLPEAIISYGRALELRPGWSELLSNRGVAFSQMKDYEKALADFAEALKYNPNNLPAKNGIAWIRATCPKDELRNTE